MSTIKDIILADGTVIYVEMDETELPQPRAPKKGGGLPSGYEEVSAVDDALDALETLQGTLKAVFTAIQESLKANSPNEWGAELNIAFKGKVNPIPVIVSTESSVAIKVHAKWVRKSENRHG